MNRKLSDWASIAEIISGIAVVITLVFLILGIRENTEIVRASAYAGSMDSLNDFTMDVITNADLRSVWQDYVNENATDFDADETQELQLLLIVLFRNYEKAYFSERYGLLGSAEWGRFERQICLQVDRARLTDESILGFLDVVLTDEFAAYVHGTCERNRE